MQENQNVLCKWVQHTQTRVFLSPLQVPSYFISEGRNRDEALFMFRI